MDNFPYGQREPDNRDYQPRRRRPVRNSLWESPIVWILIILFLVIFVCPTLGRSTRRSNTPVRSPSFFDYSGSSGSDSSSSSDWSSGWDSSDSGSWDSGWDSGSDSSSWDSGWDSGSDSSSWDSGWDSSGSSDWGSDWSSGSDSDSW